MTARLYQELELSRAHILSCIHPELSCRQQRRIVDDLYLPICAHERKARGQQKCDAKRTSFSTISSDLLCLQRAQMPKYHDPVIFMLTDEKNRLNYHAHG